VTTQVQKEKAAQKRPQEAQDAPQKDVRNQELAESVDDSLAAIEEVLEDQTDDELLAELDDVLEENAEEFVASYVQQGGE
jgi:ubiquitin-like protein Pup